MQNVYLWIVLAPLFGAVITGLFGLKIGRSRSHLVAISGVVVSFLLSLVVLYHHILYGAASYDCTVYTWMTIEGICLKIGFLVDNLTAVMICTVTFISLMVHIYTVGYMQDDDGYQRFFSYISLFTFAMLMLVMANNFLQLFFGWEGVGLVSYLLIGFWYKRESAIYASFKAFLVNRVGDFGFILGIAAVLMACNSIDYADVFISAPVIAKSTIQVIPGVDWSLMTLICILLFIGAMGKSAQVPLHVWLPDSMEGPTPISALIHAATMVTAGIFMVARMSPLFELSETALSFILVIGTITALFMGLLGIIQNDIKRVIAYSTLSQLGYMTAALGVSAYPAAIFHLMTHAFFKALLFLGAGSVIIAMHHEQDIRKMGGIWKQMPITWFTFLIGTLSLIGMPGFSGFYSKDSILEAVYASHLSSASFAYFSMILGVFVTAFYSFRLYFIVFHGETHINHQIQKHLHETPLVVTIPLILLSIPSVIIGAITIESLLFDNGFGNSIFIAPEHDVLRHLESVFHNSISFGLHGLIGLPFFLVLAGFGAALYLYLIKPELPNLIKQRLYKIYNVMDHKYFFDEIYQSFFVHGGRKLGTALWKFSDAGLIDGLLVNGSAQLVVWFASVVRRLQSGYLYTYAFSMIIGLLILLTWFITTH
jgi:NADH-quinone oxidoreductase subunit L